VLIALLLSIAAQAAVSATVEERTELEFRTSATLEYWMLTRTAAAGQAPPLRVEGMVHAVEILRSAEEDGVVFDALGDAVFSQAGSMEEAAEMFANIKQRSAEMQPDPTRPMPPNWREDRIATWTAYEQAALALASTEASFRSIHWLSRQDRLEKFAVTLEAWYGDKQDTAIAFMLDGLGEEDPLRAIPVYLVTSMPSPGGWTVRTRSGPHCIVSLADRGGDLRALGNLAEIVLHEALHALEEMTGEPGFDADTPNLLRRRLATRDLPVSSKRVAARAAIQQLPHAWIFAHTQATMQHVFATTAPGYAETNGIYARMGETAEFLARDWARHVDRQLAAGASIALGNVEFVDRVEGFLDRDRRPNILLILADDQGWADFSYLGLKDDVKTPNLDALAAQGVTMPQAYASSPICNPSRVGLITGRYQQRWNNYYYGGGQGLPTEAITLAERLKTAGYTTGYFGKVHTGGPDNGPGKPGFPMEQGFDRFFGTTCGGRVHYLHHSRAAQAEYGEAAGQMEVEPMWDDAKQIEWDGFTTVAWTDQAIEFIDRHPDRPWFTFLNYNAVHNFAWQLPAEELQARGLEQVPDWNADEVGYREWYAKMHRRDWPEGRAYYLAQLECLDREVGRLLAHVEQRGMVDNTLVIYTVDNGGCVPDWADNGPLAGSKYHLLEGGTRVRSFVRMPGVFPEGRVHEGVFSSLDFAPTICELVGVATEEGAFDGISQLAQLKGDKPADPNRTLHWDTGWQWSVRFGDWKLMVTENAQRAQASSNFEQVAVRLGTHLYHLSKDPGETNNLAEARPDLVALLTSRHNAWRASIGQAVKAGS
jgi:arylsulfatase A-like enzyme